MARRASRRSRSQRKRSDAGVAGALAKLTVRRPSAHGGYGWVRDLPDDRDFVYGAPLVRFPQGLPRSVDLRSECPPVYDQGQLGSCTGNGIAGAIEFDQRKQRTKEFTPSRLFIYYSERVIEGTVSQDAGAQIRDGIKSVAKSALRPRAIGPTTSRSLPFARRRRPTGTPSRISFQLIRASFRTQRRCAAALRRVIHLYSALRFTKALKARLWPERVSFRCPAPERQSWEVTALSPWATTTPSDGSSSETHGARAGACTDIASCRTSI
jgi:hypothetical protein